MIIKKHKEMCDVKTFCHNKIHPPPHLYTIHSRGIVQCANEQGSLSDSKTVYWEPNFGGGGCHWCHWILGCEGAKPFMQECIGAQD